MKVPIIFRENIRRNQWRHPKEPPIIQWRHSKEPLKMLTNLYYHYIYPGFFKVIAPLEMKLLLCIVITAALLDVIHRFIIAPKRRRTVSNTMESTEYLNGDLHLHHTYFDPLQHRPVNNNGNNALHNKVWISTCSSVIRFTWSLDSVVLIDILAYLYCILEICHKEEAGPFLNQDRRCRMISGFLIIAFSSFQLHSDEENYSGFAASEFSICDWTKHYFQNSLMYHLHAYKLRSGKKIVAFCFWLMRSEKGSSF